MNEEEVYDCVPHLLKLYDCGEELLFVNAIAADDFMEKYKEMIVDHETFPTFEEGQEYDIIPMKMFCSAVDAFTSL